MRPSGGLHGAGAMDCGDAKWSAAHAHWTGPDEFPAPVRPRTTANASPHMSPCQSTMRCGGRLPGHAQHRSYAIVHAPPLAPTADAQRGQALEAVCFVRVQAQPPCPSEYGHHAGARLRPCAASCAGLQWNRSAGDGAPGASLVARHGYKSKAVAAGRRWTLRE